MPVKPPLSEVKNLLHDTPMDRLLYLPACYLPQALELVSYDLPACHNSFWLRPDITSGEWILTT